MRMVRQKRLFWLAAGAALAVQACAQTPAPPSTLPSKPLSKPLAEASSPAAPDWAPSRDDLAALLDAFDVPGLSMVTLKDCTPSAPVNVGAATLDPQTPVGDDTVFETASLSKPVFAYLVLALAEEGVIDLDRPIVRDFSYDRIADLDRYRQITPRMVLSHRTGLPNWVGDTSDPDRRDRISFIAEPGETFSYSGEAFELLRKFIEAQTGEALNDLFRAQFASLMPQSTFALPLPAGVALTRGYRSSRDPASGRDLDNLTASANAAGSLVATARDYAAFLGHICARKGLSPETYAAMFEPVTPTPPGVFPAPAAYGLGWAIMTIGPETIILHGGDNDEFRSLAAIFPQADEAMVVLTNGRNGGDLIDAMIEQMQ